MRHTIYDFYIWQADCPKCADFIESTSSNCGNCGQAALTLVRDRYTYNLSEKITNYKLLCRKCGAEWHSAVCRNCGTDIGFNPFRYFHVLRRPFGALILAWLTACFIVWECQALFGLGSTKLTVLCVSAFSIIAGITAILWKKYPRRGRWLPTNERHR